ncbi:MULTISPECIES: MFS transporter permease [unclassified Microbacterium]|uniref:MFS transporter permease n=1 Tax=unclassified Microbacterium TaxID=2609290 RepID=UPI000D575C58|nr:MFS transporter permease [Microbacterium sp. Gd 4-13]PVW06423.1 MFS transporter permease [Microbacterium sp. Gd 4-13]
MWLRRLFFHWLFPAAVVLPLWLLVGWGVFQAGGLAFLWVLFIAAPSVLVGQTVLALLVRSRGSVRAERAVSWWDVLAFSVWHALIIATGFFSSWFALSLVLAILAAVGVFWASVAQLWRESRASVMLLRTADGTGYIPPTRPSSTPRADPTVVVLEERPHQS